MGTTVGVPVDLELEDLDADGDLDAYVAFGDAADQIWWNHGRGQYSSFTELPNALGSTAVALGDLDRDGDIDAVISGANLVYRNDGRGNFDQWLTLPGSEFRSVDVAIGDITRDGWPDLYFANQGDEMAIDDLFIGSSEGTWTRVSSPLRPGQSNSVQLLDIDANGTLDAVLGRETESGVALALTTEAYDEWLGRPRSSTKMIASRVGDVPAIVALTEGESARYLWGPNERGDDILMASGAAVLGDLSAQDVVTMDLDNDGRLDLFFGTDDEQGQEVWLGVDGGYLPLQYHLDVNHAIVAAASGDIDGDGDVDVVGASASGGKPGVS